MMDIVESKLKRIEVLLENDAELQKYINSIDKISIKENENLKSNIIKNIKKQNEFSNKSYSILKLAACATFAIVLCQTNFVRTGIFEKKEKSEKATVIIQSINKGVSKLNYLFTNEISFDNKEEKK